MALTAVTPGVTVETRDTKVAHKIIKTLEDALLQVWSAASAMCYSACALPHS